MQRNWTYWTIMLNTDWNEITYIYNSPLAESRPPRWGGSIHFDLIHSGTFDAGLVSHFAERYSEWNHIQSLEKLFENVKENKKERTAICVWATPHWRRWRMNAVNWNPTTKWHNFTHCAFKCADSLHGRVFIWTRCNFWCYSFRICSEQDRGNWQSSDWGPATCKLNVKKKKKINQNINHFEKKVF